MSPSPNRPIVAVDVGNTRMKLGLFAAADSAPGELPTPDRTYDVSTLDEPLDKLTEWLTPIAPQDADWRLATVNLLGSTRLIAWLRDRDAAGNVAMLAAETLPLTVEVPQPEAVGIDRLLATMAANRLRDPNRPAIVVDLGTALTADVVSAGGAFLGGVIGPGIDMSARALHEFTDQLPRLAADTWATAPEPLGTSTADAMKSGLYWGTVGAVKEAILQLSQQCSAPPQVFLSGGAAESMAQYVGPDARYVRHLVLSGIALSAP